MYVVAHRTSDQSCDSTFMSGLEMDIRDLHFQDDTFDVVIDKGTMDSMITTKGSVWNPPEEVISNCNKEVDEVVRFVSLLIASSPAV